MSLVKKRKIEFKNYSTTIFQISEELQFMERVHRFSTEKNDFDVFPSSWFLIFPEHTNSKVFLKTIFGDLEVKSKTVVFLPAKKIIRWKIYPGDIKWYAFRGESELPHNIPNEAFWFHFSEIPMFQNVEDIYSFISKNKMNSKFIPSEMTGSSLAREVKKVIDEKFDDLEDNALATIANSLRVLPNEVSIVFKKCYGMNPIEYKNRLKLNKALYRIWLEENNNITNICYESGFKEYSSFYRNFIKWLNVEPSYFSENSVEFYDEYKPI